MMRFRRRMLERKVRDEIHFHLDLRTAELIDQGLSPAEAREAAWAAFGDVDEIEAECLEVARDDSSRISIRALSESLGQDFRYAARSLRQRPMFSFIAIVTLALGIGATTAIYSVVDGVLLRSLPYPEPERLVILGTAQDDLGKPRSTSAPDYLDWKARTRSFASMGAAHSSSMTLVGDGEPESVKVAYISEDFFSTLGIGPAFGRTLTPDDFRPDAPKVGIISYGFWQRRFGGDRGLLGRAIKGASGEFTVVGITPEDIRVAEALWLGEPDVWLPESFRVRAMYQSRKSRMLRVVARLADGIGIEQARRELDVLASALIDEYPEDLIRRGIKDRIGIQTLHNETVGDASSPLFLLLGAVGFLLLIACANVANLFLARSTDRGREMALRIALGARRSRLVRQLVTESVALALVGGLLGVAIAYGCVRAFIIYNPGDLPRLNDIAVDLRVLAFAATLSVFTGVLFGLAPALRSARRQPTEALKEGAGNLTGGRNRALLRSGLVVVEIALALVLLTGAGLLFNSFVRLERVNPGFDPSGILLLPVGLGRNSGEPVAFFEGLIERIDALPGVRSAAGIINPPIGVVYWRSRVEIDAPGAQDETLGPSVNLHRATPHYFGTLGIRLLSGRDFTTSDAAEAPPVAVINETLARQFWPESDPVGQRIRAFNEQQEDPWATIVGVVSDVRQGGLNREPVPELYVPYAQESWLDFLTIVARYDGSAGQLVGPMREAVWTADPNVPLSGVQSMEERISASIAPRRFYSLLVLSFASVGLVLASAGIYGTMMYSVAQRQREMGIRMALGARASEVVRLVLGQGMRLTLLGIAIGIAGAIALSGLLESSVFGVTTTDIPTYTFVATTLAAVALAACIVPARSATRVDPVRTLKAE